MEGDDHLLCVAGNRLIDGVVDHLVDEVVQAPWAGRADVHARALANGLEPLEHGDVLGAVAPAPLGGGLGLALRGRRRSLSLAGGALPRSLRGRLLDAASGGLLCTRLRARGGLRHQVLSGPIMGNPDLSSLARKSVQAGSGPRSSSHKSTSRASRNGGSPQTKSLQITNKSCQLSRSRAVNRRDRGESAAGTASRSFSSSSAASRSSSCAQAAEVHATVITPSRSATGRASEAILRPTASAQAAWTAANGVAGATLPMVAARAVLSGRGRRRLLTPRSRGRGPRRRRPRP